MPYKLFPIITSTHPEKCMPGTPASVPWELIAPHQEQAYKNHSQTLERLSERGGLGPAEFYAVLHDESCYKLMERGLNNFGASIWLIEYQKNCKWAESHKRLQEASDVFEKNSQGACDLQNALMKLYEEIERYAGDVPASKALADAMQAAKPFLPY